MQNKKKSIAVLGMSIQLEDNQLVTKVYRKSAPTLRYSHYRSSRPKEHQLNTLRGLLYRAEKICDKKWDKIEEKFSLTNVSDVDQVVQNYKPKTEDEKLKQKEILDNLDKIHLPYIPQVSNKLKK